MKSLKVLALALTCAAVSSIIAWSVIDGVARMRSAGVMADSANKFLESLSAEQKAKAAFSFDDQERFNYHFVPLPRKGLPLKEMSEQQKQLALAFLRAGTGASGYQKATTIISLEPILAEIEGPKRQHPRDPGLYYVSIFGTPSSKSTWGWRFEGHHMSLNFTVVRGELVSNTPFFFGSNPAEVRQGPQKGLRALGPEEDHGRALITALDEKQRAVAIFDKEAPKDILSFDHRKADPLKPEGIAAAKLSKEQKALLTRLIDEYLLRMPADIAEERSKKLKGAGLDKVHFGWAGGVNKGDLHYYRVQGPTFLIEYDNTQNNGNHIHSVWRDFNGDFGTDLLQAHYRETPHEKPAMQVGGR